VTPPTTLPAEVARIAGGHLRRLDRLLPGRVEGFYVVGSTALGAYREGRSDVDFVAVLDRRLDRRELRRLRLAHLASGSVALARALPRGRWAIPGTPNGSFVAADDLTRPVTGIVPVASHTGARFAVGEAFDVNPVVWRTFASKGLPLRGPDPATLGLDPEPGVLADWNRANLDGYWRSWAERVLARRGGPGRRSGRWWTAWGALGAPRLHHTILTGEVIGKEAAGEWALTTYDPEWHPVVREGLAYWRGQPAVAVDLARAASFVLEVVRLAVDEPAGH
jgi:hypothetical protein